MALAGLAVAVLAACGGDSTAPPVASQLSFTTHPTTTGAGQPITPAITVAVVDVGLRPVKSARNIITLSMASNSANATLSGVTSVAAVDGVATFSNVSTTKLGVGYVLIATATDLIGALSRPFDVTFGPPAKLAFITQPMTVEPAETIAPAVKVEVRDAFDNKVTTATNTITMAIGTNPSGATLLGTTSVAAVSGVASFSDLSVDNAGEFYSLQATSGNLNAATSASFHVRRPINFAMLSAGYFHSCGLATDSRVFCWGNPADGRLGGTGGILAGPVSGGLAFASVSSGRDHSCGLTTNGAARCWGANGSGQLGTGNTASAPTPTAVVGSLSFASLAAGYSHTCGVTGAGVGYCWGDNSFGETGSGSSAREYAPAAVSGGLNFLTVTPGRFFTCGLTTGNVAYCWGDNSFGELGDGTKLQRIDPVPVSGQLTFASVSAGGFHACGLTTLGAAYCWGDNSTGQLGNGNMTQSSTPVEVAGGLTFASISAGNRHTCAVTTGGIGYCWGDNSDGHLGVGTTPSSSSIPVPVSGGLAFRSLTAARFHTCGVTTAGSGYCWGRNDVGALGDGTTTTSFVPVRVR
jgi:hypothetical protein